MHPNPIHSKKLRLNLAAATVLKLMRYGQSLHLEFCGAWGHVGAYPAEAKLTTKLPGASSPIRK